MPTESALAAAAAVSAAIVPIVRYLLRELRSEIRRLGSQVSDLTLAISLDVATRPSANEHVKTIARQLVSEHGGQRASELLTQGRG